MVIRWSVFGPWPSTATSVPRMLAQRFFTTIPDPRTGDPPSARWPRSAVLDTCPHDRIVPACHSTGSGLMFGDTSGPAGKFSDISLKRLTFSAGCAMIIRLQSIHAPVAQLDRVSDSDSEGHRFESCRAYRLKPLANQRFARGFALPFFAGAAGLVHCLVHQRPFFHAIRHRNVLPRTASLPLPTAPRLPLCMVVRSPAHGIGHHASALQLRATPLLHTDARGHASAPQLRSVPQRSVCAPPRCPDDCPLSGSSFSARLQGCRLT